MNERNDEVFSKRVKAGKRTYFFDVKTTRGKDLYLTITESKRTGDYDGRPEYEKHKIPYIPKPKTYTPDFRLSNGIYVETKGRFLPSDRAKHLLVREQHPDLDIRFVFSNSRQKLSKKSKTTYADWCYKHNFEFADGTIPWRWIKERPKK